MNPLAHKMSRVAASLLATITLATMVPHVANAAPETAVAASNGIAAEKCTDVIFIGARGSGEPSDAGQPNQSTNVKDKMQGFGDTVASMAYSIKQQLPQETTTSFIPVDYMALSVEEAMKMDSKYPTSVKTGIDNGTPLVRETISSCPWSKIILMGYSQGAHVMHEIVMRLDRNERDHISSALLIADPIRYPKNNNTFFTYVGDGDNFALDNSIIFTGKGVMRRAAELEFACEAYTLIRQRTHERYLLVPKADENDPTEKCRSIFSTTVKFSDVMTPGEFPDDITVRIMNVCHEDDIVCQVTFVNEDADGTPWRVRNAGIGDLAFVTQLHKAFTNSGEIHGEGYKESKFYAFPAQWSVSMIGRSPQLPEKPAPAIPSPSPSSSPTQTSAAVAAPSFDEEDWRKSATYLKERGATSFTAYANNADGAVVSFGDFFTTMAWEFSKFYEGSEDDVSSEAEKNKLIDQQLFRTMQHVDRESLGTEKVNALFSEWGSAASALGKEKVEIRASRDGVQVAPDGTVTIALKNVFFMDPSTGEVEAIDEGSDSEYKLAYKYEKWSIVDVNLDGPLK